MGAEASVRHYKNLSRVERAFRTFKSLDLEVRPLRHRRQRRVRAPLFLGMRAYYVEWHMGEAWRPLLFADDDQVAKATRNPVAPAQRSEAARAKGHSRRLDEDTAPHSFRTLLTHLGSIVRNRCRVQGASGDMPTFELTTTPDAKQQQALDLLERIRL